VRMPRPHSTVPGTAVAGRRADRRGSGALATLEKLAQALGVKAGRLLE
jgi:hypothetical protein